MRGVSWNDLAQENFEAASLLRERKLWRPCVSRAYYAAYAEVTGRLVELGLTPREHMGTWSHDAIPDMIRWHLMKSSRAAAENMAIGMTRLYALRVIADYDPLWAVGDRESYTAMGLMNQVFRMR